MWMNNEKKIEYVDSSINYRRIWSQKVEKKYYRLGPVNSNTVNSKFHLIQTFFKICETFLYFQC